MREYHVYPFESRMRMTLKNMLVSQKQIFTFEEQPLLASLITCLGIQSEIGLKELDRLSVPLGIVLKEGANPWKTEIITQDQQFGIRMWIPEIKEFFPRHPDFAEILDPLSCVHGKLSQIVIFPERVAQSYKRRGLTLVIVRDWAITAFLDSQKVNYLRANRWEMEQNIARIQAELMLYCQVAFSGTHDLSDHLLGGHQKGWTQNRSLFVEVHELLQQPPVSLRLNYFISVLLDDLAQPLWYGSETHIWLVQQIMSLIRKVEKLKEELIVPREFQQLMRALRNGVDISKISKLFKALEVIFLA